MDTRQYVALVGHHWGAGESPALALESVRKAGARASLRDVHVYELPIGTRAARVDGLGRFWWEWDADAPDKSDTHCRELDETELRAVITTKHRRAR